MSTSAGSPVSRIVRRSWRTRYPAHSSKLTVRAASPSGCRQRRNTFGAGDRTELGQIGGERARRGVRQHDVPLPVDHDAGVRIVRVEHPLERRLDLRHRRVGQVARRVPGCESGGEQHRVALAQRHVEVLGDGEHELRARPGLAGLDEAEVPGRHTDVERQVELTAPPPGPPVAHQRSDRLGCHDGNGNGRPRGTT